MYFICRRREKHIRVATLMQISLFAGNEKNTVARLDLLRGGAEIN